MWPWGKQISPDLTWCAHFGHFILFSLFSCGDLLQFQTKVEEGELIATKKRDGGQEEAANRGLVCDGGTLGILNTYVQLRTLACGPPDWQRMGLQFVLVGKAWETCELKIIVRLVFISCQCICSANMSSRKCLNTSAETTLGNLHSWRTSHVQHPWRQRQKPRFVRLTASPSRHSAATAQTT